MHTHKWKSKKIHHRICMTCGEEQEYVGHFWKVC